MTEIVVAPVYVLIDYAFGVLNANDPQTWDRSKYGGLIPIVPLNEEPELQEYDTQPRIIYEFSNSETGTQWFKGRGQVTFAVHDHNFRRLTKAMNILEESFGRYDESARDVNDYVQRLKDRPVQKIDFDISFGHIRCTFSQSGTPEQDEGGPMIGLVNIQFDYFVEYDILTRPVV